MSGYSPILSILALLVGGAIVFVVVSGIVIGALASGDAGEPPRKCRNSEIDLESATSPVLRDVLTDPALAQQWQQRWDAFEAQLDSGSPASVTFEEGEVTSRAAQWVDETGAPLEDVTICFYDGVVEARGHAEIPVLADAPIIGGAFESDVRVLGRIDLGSEHPQITIAEFSAGDLPDWATDPVQEDIEEIVNDRLAAYDTDHTYTVTYREGQIEITDQP